MSYSLETKLAPPFQIDTRKSTLRQRVTNPSHPFRLLLLDSIRMGAITQSDFIPLNGLSFMATPAQLVNAISETTGIPLPTVVDIDRKLVQGKLRTKGGRGFSAAQMTPLDAARLLTAALGSPQANASVEAVERYANTRVDRTRSSDKLFGAAMLDDLAALPARHGFVDALAALIASAATGSLAKLMADSVGGWVPHIEVFAFTRACRGRIRIAGLPKGGTASIEYIPSPADTKTRVKPMSRSRDAYTHVNTGDLEQSRRITERTILPIAKLLA
jgi:hypothetical protein